MTKVLYPNEENPSFSINYSRRGNLLSVDGWENESGFDFTSLHYLRGIRITEIKDMVEDLKRRMINDGCEAVAFSPSNNKVRKIIPLLKESGLVVKSDTGAWVTCYLADENQYEK